MACAAWYGWRLEGGTGMLDTLCFPLDLYPIPPRACPEIRSLPPTRPCSVKMTPSPGQETLQESFLKESEGDLLILA